jgi:hypothetical protein
VQAQPSFMHECDSARISSRRCEVSCGERYR